MLTDKIDTYLKSYKLRGLHESSEYESRNSLEKFMQYCEGQEPTQKIYENFIFSLIDSGISDWTINKHIANCNAFFAWAGYPIHAQKRKVDQLMVRALRDEEIKRLIESAPTLCFKMLVILGLCIGERYQDLLKIRPCDFDLERMSVDVSATKTGKAFPCKPLPDDLKPLLEHYLNTIRFSGGSLFPDVNKRRVWEKMREDAGLPEVTLQDLRVTYGTLTAVAQFGPSQLGLSHSSVKTTKTHYIDRFLVLKSALCSDRFPVKQWIKWAGFDFDRKEKVS